MEFELLTVKEMAEKTGYHEDHIYRLHKEGVIKGVKRGVALFLSAEYVAVLIQRRNKNIGNVHPQKQEVPHGQGQA